jgi:hypothetical protein
VFVSELFELIINIGFMVYGFVCEFWLSKVFENRFHCK